jgi:hypothetical protein
MVEDPENITDIIKSMLGVCLVYLILGAVLLLIHSAQEVAYYNYIIVAYGVCFFVLTGLVGSTSGIATGVLRAKLGVSKHVRF